MLTLLFVLLPITLNSIIIIVSYARNLNLEIRIFCGEILRTICIVLQLEMLCW